MIYVNHWTHLFNKIYCVTTFTTPGLFVCHQVLTFIVRPWTSYFTSLNLNSIHLWHGEHRSFYFARLLWCDHHNPTAHLTWTGQSQGTIDVLGVLASTRRSGCSVLQPANEFTLGRFKSQLYHLLGVPLYYLTSIVSIFFPLKWAQ